MGIRRTFALVALTLLLGVLAPDVEAALPVEIPDCDPDAALLDHSIRLGGDVGPCPGSGIIVTEPKVTLDLAGFSIFGDGADAPGIEVGVRGLSPGLTVLNGVVRDFEEGIGTDTAKATFKGVVAIRNAVTGLRAAGDGAKLIGNTVMGNVGGGITVVGVGGTVQGNSVTGNTLEGILITGGSAGLKVIKNTVTGNGTIGIDIAAGSSGIVVKGNVLNGNQIGLEVNGTDHKITSNIASGNGDYGFKNDGVATTANVSKNVVNSNGYAAAGVPGEGIFGGPNWTGSNNITIGNEVGNCTIAPFC